jgi:recombination protein RecT
MANENAITVYNINEHEQFLSKQREKMDRWMAPGVDLRSDALTRHALHEMQLNPALQACTPVSMYMALLGCAVLGLVPGKMRGLAYLIPFGNKRKTVDSQGNGKEFVTQEATLVIGWQGVKLMGFRAGIDMMSAVVHENDLFDYDKGTTPFVRYRAALRNAGAVIGTAAWVKLPNGSLEIEYLDTEALGKIEAFAKSKRGESPAWDGPFKDQMQRKSALRRLGKQVGPGLEFFKAEAIENAIEDNALSSALDQLTDGEATKGLDRQLVEAAAFGEAPRSAQVQVPAGPAKTKARETKPVEAAAVERPTGSAPTSSPAPASGPSPATLTATSPTPAPQSTGGGGTEPRPTPPFSPTAPPPSTESAFPAATPSATSSGAHADEGDVASEPGPGEPFDASFGAAVDEPVQAPMTIERFEAWLPTVKSQAELNEGKPPWMEWSRTLDKKDAATGDILKRLRDGFSKRWSALEPRR